MHCKNKPFIKHLFCLLSNLCFPVEVKGEWVSALWLSGSLHHSRCSVPLSRFSPVWVPYLWVLSR